ncbi:hypothetical protein LWF15_33580 [Kineosporia rhizophila]|uniref:hypothetical protein n=1 Tax=Kineosporia rhizophila TaxID=84633 RepID=UPI000A525BC4|nr:hypothetical protein [Kineosporia rhizophila]MCE0540437.1 hypothetical protein [Kineosporia rhizophila]
MLSTEFSESREWCVSAREFEHLCDAATAGGATPLSLVAWRHIAPSKRGPSVTDLDDAVGQTLTEGFYSTATQELTDAESGSLDVSYRIALEKLLAVLL